MALATTADCMADTFPAGDLPLVRSLRTILGVLLLSSIAPIADAEERHYTAQRSDAAETLSIEKGSVASVFDSMESPLFKYASGDDEEELELSAKFGEGFTLESEDARFQLRTRVLSQVDGKLFLPTVQEPARSGLYIPRFRIYFEGQLTDLVEYELSLQRSVEGAFDVLDANTNFHMSDAFQLRIGRGLVPYSYAWYDHLEQFYITPERGLFALNFGLARQTGALVHGKLHDDQLQYAFAATFGQLSGLADTNSSRDGLGYVNFRPFLHSEEIPFLQFLNLGGSFAIGEQVYDAKPLPLRTSLQSSENDEAAEAASSIFLEFNDTATASGPRWQAAIHAACYAGPFSFEAEWYAGQFQIASDPSSDTTAVPLSGYDVTLASFLTGETIENRSTLVPLRPFTGGSDTGPGAIEVFSRYSKLNISDRIFTADIADPADWTNEAAMTDIGCNWYLNRFVRFTLDWQHAMYSNPILLNEAQDLRSRTNDLFWLRCQLYF